MIGLTADVAHPVAERPPVADREAPLTGPGSDYARLSRSVRAAGLLRRRPGYYAIKIAANLLLLAAGWAAFFLLGRSWWQLLVAVFLAVMFTQTGFIGHDAGHRQISGSKRTDDLIGRIHGNLLIGLSYGWWTDKHRRHHAHPNQLGRDPDTGGRAIAFTRDQSRARHGIGSWLAGYQAWLFFPMLLLEGFHLHAVGFRGLLRRRGRTTAKLVDGALLAAHIIGYLAAVFLVLSPVQAVAFVLLQQGLFGVYLGCSFAPNHKGMPVLGEDEKSDFLRRQVITSRNIRGVAHRPRPWRPRLPDRASSAPLHATAQLAACPGTGACVLRAARHRLPRQRILRLLRTGPAAPEHRGLPAARARALNGRGCAPPSLCRSPPGSRWARRCAGMPQ
jgi:fatty acid desaturase